MHNLIITHYPWSHAQVWVTPIRYNVFVREQKLPLESEFDDLEPASAHFVVFCGNQPIATARLTPNCHISRMAVQIPWRGQGIGLEIVHEIIEYTGNRDLHLTAQRSTMGFYERLGFTCHSNAMSETGTEHFKMTRPGGRAAA